MIINQEVIEQLDDEKFYSFNSIVVDQLELKDYVKKLKK